MKEINLSSGFEQAQTWLGKNEDLLIDFAVNFALAIIILIVGSIAARIAGKLVCRLMQARGIDVTITQFVSALARYAVLIFTFIAVLGHLGIQTASIIAVLGAAGLAVGLALQGSLSNLAAGVILVIFRPFRVGEFVDFGGVSGTIRSIQIFSTSCSTADGKTVVIPNSKVIANNIINFTREPNRRVEIVVGVGYEADIDVVKNALTEVIEADKRVIKSLGVTVRLNEMAPSSLNFVARAWVKNADFSDVYFDLMENFKRQLDKHQINIPYPQMDVRVHQPEV